MYGAARDTRLASGDDLESRLRPGGVGGGDKRDNQTLVRVGVCGGVAKLANGPCAVRPRGFDRDRSPRQMIVTVHYGRMVACQYPHAQGASQAVLCLQLP